jgi:hypothetical protein
MERIARDASASSCIQRGNGAVECRRLTLNITDDGQYFQSSTDGPSFAVLLGRAFLDLTSKQNDCISANHVNFLPC